MKPGGAAHEHGLLRSAGVVSAAVLLSRLTGLVREMAMARLFGAGAANDAVKTLLGEVTMHVTAGMPQVALAVSREQLPAEVVAREKVAAAEGIDPKKPPQIVEKIVAGKLDKVLGEIVLLEQPFVKEEKQKIRDLVAIASKTGGTPVTIARFARLKVGEV